jgi:hypothetical protein
MEERVNMVLYATLSLLIGFILNSHASVLESNSMIHYQVALQYFLFFKDYMQGHM